MISRVAPLQEQFTSRAQQRLAATFGMWVFLATEVLFFGGMLVSYTVYRLWYPAGFAAGSHHLDVVLGTLNTAILIVSSFCMAVAVSAARELNRPLTLICLALTVALGLTFLGIKGYEWVDAYRSGFWPGNPESAAQPHGFRLFFSFYYGLTGLHGLHMIIGLCFVTGFGVHWWRQPLFRPNQNQATVLALYWHFVDIVWIFLYPLLYLIQRYAA
jgi:cytochrome c oxidase subunit 3